MPEPPSEPSSDLPLAGLHVVEVSAFIAAPLAGLTLAGLGATVTRVDPPGGGIDRHRWPLAPDGSSFYFAGLNRGKRIEEIDLKSTTGRARFHDLLREGGPDGGILLTNLAGASHLSHETLRTVRDDVITVELAGHHDGAPAVDYTVNAAVGVPLATGPRDAEGPVNHTLPAWDGMAGTTLAAALLAALRARDRDGRGRRVRVALADVAMAFLSATGVLAEAQGGHERPRDGNHLFGAFGHDLPTRDGRHVMVVAITGRQWRSLVAASGLAAVLDGIAERLGVDLDTDGGRYRARREIVDALSAWSRTLALSDLLRVLERHRVLHAPYRSFREMLRDDPRAAGPDEGGTNPMFAAVDHGPAGRYRVAGSPIRIERSERPSGEAA